MEEVNNIFIKVFRCFVPMKKWKIFELNEFLTFTLSFNCLFFVPIYLSYACSFNQVRVIQNILRYLISLSCSAIHWATLKKIPFKNFYFIITYWTLDLIIIDFFDKVRWLMFGFDYTFLQICIRRVKVSKKWDYLFIFCLG